ncbi:MAG: site-specific integrase [Acinetobacter sp.]|nr:MAG: site-specific integrase [Acinetobacter sp.]
MLEPKNKHENGFTLEIFLQFLGGVDLYHTKNQKIMSVAIRVHPLKNNKSMLHLEVTPKGGKTKLKSLKLSIYDKPKTRPERDHNREVWEKANRIKVAELSQLQLGMGSYVTSQRDFLEYFKSLVRERRKNEGSYGNWNSTYKHLVEFCNNKKVRLCDVDEVFLNKFKKFLLEGELTKSGTNLSQNSASSYFLKVRAALNEAYNQRLINDNPVRRVKGISPEETYRERLTSDEVKLLAKTECKVPILKKAFLFACLTGLRWSDVNKLTWGQITYNTDECIWKIDFIQKKTKNIQYLPISKSALELLGIRKADEERVFQGLKYSAWNNHILAEWVYKDAGIKKHVTFHISRHSMATILLGKQVPLVTVSSILGHKDLKTTMIYAKIMDSERNNAVNLLPQIEL